MQQSTEGLCKRAAVVCIVLLPALILQKFLSFYSKGATGVGQSEKDAEIAGLFASGGQSAPETGEKFAG
jgi:hypothetical protein